MTVAGLMDRGAVVGGMCKNDQASRQQLKLGPSRSSLSSILSVDWSACPALLLCLKAYPGSVLLFHFMSPTIRLFVPLL